jgi:hypothetical protein
MTVWGKPEEIYLTLKEGFDKARIPVRGWEPDNNWIVTFGDAGLGGKPHPRVLPGDLYGNASGPAVAKAWHGRQVRVMIAVITSIAINCVFQRPLLP